MDNIKQLRESLMDNYQKIITGEISIALGKTLANTAGKILTSCLVEMEYNKIMENKKVIKFLET